MKPILLVLPLLLAAASCSKRESSHHHPEAVPEPTLTERAEQTARDVAEKSREVAGKVAEKTKETAKDVKEAVANKLEDWNLTPSDIRTDLEKTGRVVRTKSKQAGTAIAGVADNARIVTVVNAKYVADRELSALKINVDAKSGVVTLRGSVASPELIGRAIALALDTDGVHEVISLLTVQP